MATTSAATRGPTAFGAVERQEAHTEREAFTPVAIARMGVALLGAPLAWWRLGEVAPGFSVPALVALLVAAWPVLRQAGLDLVDRRMTMELSMAIAILAATAIGELVTALIVTLFVLLAEELEHVTVARGRRAIKDLVDFIPAEARRRRGDTIELVPLAELAPGDVALVNPGEKVPVDGEVVSGQSYVDQSRITGESMPVAAGQGARVFAGSINQMGHLEIAVAAVGRDTTYGRIVEAVESAEHARAPVQKLADRLAGWLVRVAFLAAGLTWLITRDITDTISVIIVAGACGIAAGTPLAILGGIGRAARMGSIIKGGIHLETLGRVDTVVLDKTGTLTMGEPVVTALRPAAGVDEAELLIIAAAAERHSEHPLARAVVAEAERRGLNPPEPEAVEFLIARGLRATTGGRVALVGNRKLLAEAGIPAPPRAAAHLGSDIVVALDGRFLGEIEVADPIRPEAREAIAGFKRLGLSVLLFTGDAKPVAAHVAETLGITDVVSDMLPQDKLARVEALVAGGAVVAMVGDGVNDAPALTAAQVGVAMGSGTDIAKESADVVLIGNDLEKLVKTLEIARATRRVIFQNFAGTLGVDAIGIALAATGHLDPLLAAGIHVGSELVFLANSARLVAPARGKAAP